MLFLSVKNGVQSLNDYKIIGDVRDGSENSESGYKINEKLPKLLMYNSSLKVPNHLSINSRKIFYIDFEKYKESSSGSVFNLNMKIKLNENSYPTKIFVASAANRNYIDFTWLKCEFGLIMVDDQLNENTFYTSTKLITVDYAILILLKSRTKKIHYTTVPYFSKIFLLYPCPYGEYTTEYSNIRYIPNKYVLENGVFFFNYEKPSHLFIPIFQGSNGDNFFACGILRQPTLPDITLGYKLESNGNEDLRKKIEETNIQTIDSCSEPYDNNKVTYTYLDEDSQFTNSKIFINTKKDNSEYINQKKYFYNLNSFDRNIFNSTNTTNEIFIIPSCMVTSENREFLITPTVDGLKTIDQENVRYLFIKDSYSSGNFSVRCLSEVNNENEKRYKNYYSKGADILVIKKDSVNNTKLKGEKLLMLSKESLESYGEYTCNVVKTAKSLNGKSLQVKSVYILPENYMTVPLQPANVLYNKNSYPHCKKVHQNVGKLIKIEVSNDKSETIGLLEIFHSTSIFDVTKDFVNFIPLHPEYQITINCNYQTMAKTFFTTVQKFIIYNSSDRRNNKYHNNTANMIHPFMNPSEYLKNIDPNGKQNSHPISEEDAILFSSIPFIILGIITCLIIVLTILFVISQLIIFKQYERYNQPENINDINA
uniref:Ig-like domain-containing protein n=1 Tax=Strongyloides papillosus TaxID=174720 RepID=A0A0N5BIG1_STREA